jgi:hypothetical protein
MLVEQDGQAVPAADWPKLGIKPFSLRLVAYLDKMSNRGEPKVKFTLLFFPAKKEQMEQLSDAVQGQAGLE